MEDFLIGAVLVLATVLLLLFWAALVSIAVRICLGLARLGLRPSPKGAPPED